MAQLTEAPKPIPAPPIPPPAKPAPAPKVTLGSPVRPLKQPLPIPPPPNVAPVVFPVAPMMTEADKKDPVPPPPPGTLTGPLPRTSPGASGSGIEMSAFLIDPASSQVPAQAQAKLRAIAQTLKALPEARVEIRAYAPIKGQNESDARRLALARCIAVRDALVGAGVPDDHIDLRALGAEPTEQNADRIELYVEH